MKKILCLLLILIISAIAQEPGQRFKYRVDNFRGGVNLAGDSTDLANDEYLVGQNFVLTQNSIESRHGISHWNLSQIDTFEIDNIFIYEPYPDTMRLIIACGGFIYVIPTLDNPAWDTTSFPGDVDSAWSQYKIGFADSGLNVTNGSKVVGGRLWTSWYTNVSGGDILKAGNTEYEIRGVSAYRDTVIYLDVNYTGSTDDSTNYEIFRKIKGTPSLKQERGKLYISDSQGFTIVYDDTNYQFLALVDSGSVTSVTALEDTSRGYSTGTVSVARNSNIVRMYRDAHWGVASGVDSGDVFVLLWDNVLVRSGRHGRDETWLNGRFASTIIEVDTLNGTLELADNIVLTTEGGQVISQWATLTDQRYEIKEYTRPCHSDANLGINDANKNWSDIQYGDHYLTDFRYVNGDSGFASYLPIYCNNDSMIAVDTGAVTVNTADDYYIFSRFPFNHDTTLIFGADTYPFYEQVMFNNGQLLAFGNDIIGGYWELDDGILYYKAGHSDNLNRVWFSEIDIPTLTKSTYFFDIGTTEDISAMFELSNGVYIATNSSIWRVSGIASTDVIRGDLNYRKVTSHVGIKDLNSWTLATLEYIYFADETGIYYFNGIRPEKISRPIDPIIDKYYQSETVLGYYDSKLYISYPDSNITWIYDEDFDAFVGPFTFGMTCFNHQSADIDTNIFFFGHPDTLGYVFFYPNSVYWDSMPGTSQNIAYEYRSGHQSHGDYSYPKKVNEVTASVQSPGVMTFYTYNDFSSTPADSFVTDSTGNFVYVPSFDRGLAFGEYIQYGIKASAGEKVVIRDYEVALQWLNRFTK